MTLALLANANILVGQQDFVTRRRTMTHTITFLDLNSWTLKSISTNAFISLLVQRNGITFLSKRVFCRFTSSVFLICHSLTQNGSGQKPHKHNSQNPILKIISSPKRNVHMSSFFPILFCEFIEFYIFWVHHWINHYYIPIITLTKQVSKYYFEMTNCDVISINLS